jgi:hypothetical protein
MMRGVINMIKTIDTIINSIPDFFNPEKATGRSISIGYELHDEKGDVLTWTVIVDNGKCSVVTGLELDLTVKMVMGAEDYIRLVNGVFDYEKCRWRGRMRFIGNTLAHRELNYFLDIPDCTGYKWV